jgi:hypothetical protein
MADFITDGDGNSISREDIDEKMTFIEEDLGDFVEETTEEDKESFESKILPLFNDGELNGKLLHVKVGRPGMDSFEERTKIAEMENRLISFLGGLNIYCAVFVTGSDVSMEVIEPKKNKKEPTDKLSNEGYIHGS